MPCQPTRPLIQQAYEAATRQSLHQNYCIPTLPDPWPLAKVTINIDSSSQWALKMEGLLLMKCLANKQLPQQQIALKAQDMLTDLEMRIILRMACGTSNACETCPRTRSSSWQ